MNNVSVQYQPNQPTFNTIHKIDFTFKLVAVVVSNGRVVHFVTLFNVLDLI